MKRMSSIEGLNQVGQSGSDISLMSQPSTRSLSRPKSTPSTIRSKTDVPATPDDIFSGKKSRPRTAVELSRPGPLDIMTKPPVVKTKFKHCCDRVHQVEHEATRKQTFEPHLPLKKPKTPPWQQKLDVSRMIAQRKPVLSLKGRTSPCVSAPGYILSRGKSKVAMYIKTDDFFDPQHDPNRGGRRGDLQSEVAARDALVAELQKQIDDLKLFLEEERLNHRETRRKGGDQLRDRLNELDNEHENSMRIVIEQYEEQIQKTQQQHKEVLQQHVHAAETSMAKQAAEIEFLHGAFESYKSRLHTEMDEKWKKKEEDQRIEYENQLQEKIHEVKTTMISEYAAEKNELAREHEREIQRTRKEHKKELDGLLRRFSNAAADMERLKEMDAQMKVLEAEHESIKSQYDLVCNELSERTRDLTDTKVHLISFEQNFQDKVKEVDERYKVQIHELMVQNTELRRLYVQKCGQLFDEKAMGEVQRMDRLSNAKETMKTVIRARNRANINIAATDMRLEKMLRVPKERPASAPVTNSEDRGARLSAGETASLPKSVKPAKKSRPQTTQGRITSEGGCEDEEDED